MSTFVLVHGAWHGGWCWSRVRRALQAKGHEVFTPTLTGVADRSHLLSPDVDLQTHVRDVANLIRWEELSDVVLCGHSYGGCVISGVGDLMADRIAALVYLDAFVVKDGQGLHDMLPPEQFQMQVDAARETGDGWRVPPIPAEVFGVNAQDSDWVNSQCTPQPLATFQQRLRLTGALKTIKDNTYILASGWTGAPFGPSYEQAKLDGWSTIDIPCGHDVMLDMPDELTSALLAIAQRAT